MQELANAEESAKKVNDTPDKIDADDQAQSIGAQEDHEFENEQKPAEIQIDGKEEVANDITGH